MAFSAEITLTSGNDHFTGQDGSERIFGMEGTTPSAVAVATTKSSATAAWAI